MNRPLSVKLSALADAEKVLPKLLDSAAFFYGYKPAQIFDRARPVWGSRLITQLDVLRRLMLSVPTLTDGQAARLLKMDPRTVKRMRATMGKYEAGNYKWKL